MSVILKSPKEMMLDIAVKVREKRLHLNWSQQTLSDRSGVAFGTLKKFERTGQISLESLLKLGLVLDALEDFETLFKPSSGLNASSLDALLKEIKRRRGRT